MEKHLIKQKDKEEFKRGDLTVAQYKVAAKIADSLHNKILEKIEDVNLKFEKTKITGKKIITDEQNRNHSIIPEDYVGIRTAKTETVGDEKLISKISRSHNNESNKNIKQNRPTNEEIKNKTRFRFRR